MSNNKNNKTKEQKENLLEQEQELYSMLESRNRLVAELLKLDKTIELSKGLLLHRFEINDIKIGNIFKVVKVNLEKPIPLKEIKSVITDENIIFECVVAKIDYPKTLKSLENKGFVGLQGESIINALKSLQSDYFNELELKGKR